MAKARKQRGLERKTIEADSRLAAILPGVAPGEKISPLDVTRKLSDYIRRENLALGGWEVKIDRNLHDLTGLPEGHGIDRRELVSKIWSYIRGHGLQRGNPDSEIDRAFDEAKREVKKRVRKGEIEWGGWSGLALVGGILLGLLLLQRAAQGGQPTGGGGTLPPAGQSGY
jgi:hypothetical protein